MYEKGLHMEIQIKKLNDTAIIPTKAHIDDAGWDLYSNEERIIQPHTTEKIHTGVSMALPSNVFGAIFARSSTATKRGLRPANCVGVCDAGYRGEYIVPLFNDSSEPHVILKGERVAQLVLLPVIQSSFVEVEELPESDRDAGGFGSTGR